MLKMEFLPGTFLYDVPKRIEGTNIIEHNFLLRALRLINTSSENILIQRIKFDVFQGSKKIRSISYFVDVIEDRIKELERIKAISDGDPWRLKVFLGQETFWNLNNLTFSRKLNPNQEVGWIKEHFQFTNSKNISHLEIKVIFSLENSPDAEYSEKLRIPIKIYNKVNDYILPLSGTWLTVGLFTDRFKHRQMHSQEFAIDFIQYDENLKFPEDQKLQNTEFSFYQSEIKAIADGTILDTFDGVPENPTSGFIMFQDQNMRKELINKYGYLPAFVGNYIVIEHEHNEYSFYAHFSTNTIKVKKGDHVKQGQVIGLLGNSGNSSAPHLHFHLTNNPDPFVGRGLPCEFVNIIDIFGNPINLIQENWSIIHTTEI